MKSLPFKQVDVFTSHATKGNPVAVVFNADELSDETMASFANWTNLSETTFVQRPHDPSADYRLRIYTPARELSFAGHPTLGSCRAWLDAGHIPKADDIIQECKAGLITIRRFGQRLAFKAPPTRQREPIDAATREKIINGLQLSDRAIVATQRIDNGSVWFAVKLRTREEVLAIQPKYAALGGMAVGVVAPYSQSFDNSGAQFEVRAFISARSGEDPVTGSLSAALGQWLISSGAAPKSYVANQGAALGRAGEIFVQQIEEDIWIGGDTVVCIDGMLSL